jgi:predicted nucleic acid-binding Zn ribbon protein
MPLTDCPDCGNPISTEAYCCPKCGRPTEKQQSHQIRWRKFIILWLVLIFAFLVIWQFMSTPS